MSYKIEFTSDVKKVLEKYKITEINREKPYNHHTILSPQNSFLPHFLQCIPIHTLSN